MKKLVNMRRYILNARNTILIGCLVLTCTWTIWQFFKIQIRTEINNILNSKQITELLEKANVDLKSGVYRGEVKAPPAVSQLACQPPEVPVDAPALMVKFKPHPPIDCGVEPDWLFVDAGRIHFRSDLASQHAGVACQLTPVTRVDDFKVKLEAEVTLKENGTTMPSEAVFVKCKDDKGKEFKVRMEKMR